jgi:N-glycosylase/DNA lyase
VVRSLCPVVEEQVMASGTQHWSESDLRRELVACILGSQITYEAAVRFTQNLEHAGLLADPRWSSLTDDRFGREVLEVLSGKRSGLPLPGRHRFYRTRSVYLERVRNTLARQPLSPRLSAGGSARDLRQGLVADIAGLGPKQASLFLRNIGRGYDLAVLDKHVLRFMDMQGLLDARGVNTATNAGYDRVESIASAYAAAMGYRTGLLDVAIWATMKAACDLRA